MIRGGGGGRQRVMLHVHRTPYAVNGAGPPLHGRVCSELNIDIVHDSRNSLILDIQIQVPTDNE
eukprot:11524509-Alexandrium_andersonii.AAC.1